MDPSQLLREARRHAGYNQRQLAAAAGVSPRMVMEAEASRRRISAAALDAMLAACGLDLTLCSRSAVAVPEEQRAYLRLSTSARLRQHCGGSSAESAEGIHLWQQLVELASHTHVLLDPVDAVGVWVPGLPVLERAAVAVRRAQRRGPLPDTPLLDVRWLPEQRSSGWRTGVRIAVPRFGWVVVPPPAELLLDSRCRGNDALRAAARCLHLEVGRDEGGRRAPPHRDPDETEEARNLRRSLTYGMSSLGLPSATDSRGWRIDAPVSLRQWHLDNGHPPRRGSRRIG